MRENVGFVDFCAKLFVFIYTRIVNRYLSLYIYIYYIIYIYFRIDVFLFQSFLFRWILDPDADDIQVIMLLSVAALQLPNGRRSLSC